MDLARSPGLEYSLQNRISRPGESFCKHTPGKLTTRLAEIASLQPGASCEKSVWLDEQVFVLRA